MRNRLLGLVASVALVVAAAIGPASTASAQGDTLINVGSPPAPFSANKQNEPAVAVDAAHPTVLAAGANDNIDMERCDAGDPTTCPFTEGVGVSGIYFSFDSGRTWSQPTYTGLCTALHGCAGARSDCAPRGRGTSARSRIRRERPRLGR